jgi:hypothetical protein
MSNIIKAFQAYEKNDMRGLVDMMQSFDMDKKLMDLIVKQHNEVLSGLSNPKEVSNAAFRSYQDKFIKDIYAKQTGPGALSQSTQQILNNNPSLKNGIGRIQSVMANLYTRFKFFEFKYVEMNLFMMKFVDEVQHLFEKSTQLSVAHVAALQRENEVQFQAFVDSMLQLDTENDKEMYANIEKMSETTKKKFTEVHDNFSLRINDVTQQRAALLDVIKQLIEKDVQLAGDIKAVVTTTQETNRRSAWN